MIFIGDQRKSLSRLLEDIGICEGELMAGDDLSRMFPINTLSVDDVAADYDGGVLLLMKKLDNGNLIPIVIGTDEGPMTIVGARQHSKDSRHVLYVQCELDSIDAVLSLTVDQVRANVVLPEDEALIMVHPILPKEGWISRHLRRR